MDHINLGEWMDMIILIALQMFLLKLKELGKDSHF